MIAMVEMDEQVALREQLNDDDGPVVLINKFNVKREEADDLIHAWAEDAAWMKLQAGFISAQLHRGIAGSTVFLNYAVWESAGHFARAFANPEFQSRLRQYPASTVASPHLFRKLSIPGICLA
ncbi:MAG: antibiotic biosynthesis monooxygenase family protein [Candidatus Binataceae bacterium]